MDEELTDIVDDLVLKIKKDDTRGLHLGSPFLRLEDTAVLSPSVG